MQPRTLIADDQPDVLEALRQLLKSEGHQIEMAGSPAGVLERIAKREFDLLLMDLNYARCTTSGREGLELITKVQEMDRTLPIVAMTAWGNVDLAVEAMQRGVRDFVQKPWDNRRLLASLRRALDAGRARRGQIAAQREMAYELEEARAIDERMAPATPPVIAGVELAAARLVVRTVGGDYFDVIRFDDGTAALCIADVIGKGIPAAMLLANLQAAVRALASPGLPPAEMCRRLNRALCQNMPPGKFITLVYALLDPASGRLTYANAGHSLPALLRAGGGVEYLREGGTVLGVFRDWSYQQAELVLGAGDRLLLYTDGVTEARNAEGEEFGEERLLAAARASHHNAAEGVKNRIFAALEGFAGGFQDDATLLVVAR